MEKERISQTLLEKSKSKSDATSSSNEYSEEEVKEVEVEQNSRFCNFIQLKKERRKLEVEGNRKKFDVQGSEDEESSSSYT